MFGKTLLILILALQYSLIFSHGTFDQYEYDPSAAAGRYIYTAALSFADDPFKCLSGPMYSKNQVFANMDYAKGLANNNDTFSVVGVKVGNEIIFGFNGDDQETNFWDQFIDRRILPTGKLVLDDQVVNVHRYWLEYFLKLNPFIERYLDKHYKAGDKITFVGYGFGGAIASISSLYYSEANQNQINPIWLSGGVSMYTFGMPRVGDYGYARVHDQFVQDSWRITRSNDIVPHLPLCGSKSYKVCSPDFGNYHHGEEVYYSVDMTDIRKFSNCGGLPKNEDVLCSNRNNDFSMEHHNCYFSLQVAEFCKLGNVTGVC